MFLGRILLLPHQDCPWRDCIDLYSWCKSPCEATGKHDYSRLGNTIGKVPGPCLNAPQRGDVYDLTALTLEHFTPNCLRTKECSLQVNVECSIPDCFGGPVQRAFQKDGRVIYEEIHPPKSLDRTAEEPENVSPLRNIGTDGVSLSPLLPQL